MASDAAKAVVPESVLRKRKRKDFWAADKKEMVVAVKKKAGENRKVIFARAKQYAEEYDDQDKELMQLNFGIHYSINAMHPKTRKIPQLLRLRLRKITWSFFL